MLPGPCHDSPRPGPGRVGAGGVSRALPKPLMVDYGSPDPFPPVPQARLGAWPPVCWQNWGWGGGEATSNCPGKTSSLLTSLLSRRRGKRPGQAHPMPGSYLSPPSSRTLLFSPRPTQAWAPRPGAGAALTLGRSGSRARRHGRQEALKQAQRLPSEGRALPGAHSRPISGPRRRRRRELGLLDSKQEAVPGQASST